MVASSPAPPATYAHPAGDIRARAATTSRAGETGINGRFGGEGFTGAG
jgi:hypothetical protein